MTVHINGSKGKELYYNGTKIKEAYYGGTKVYDSIRPLYYCYVSSPYNYHIYFTEEIKTLGVKTGYISGGSMGPANNTSQLYFTKQLTVRAIYDTYINAAITSNQSLVYDWYRRKDKDLYS